MRERKFHSGGGVLIYVVPVVREFPLPIAKNPAGDEKECVLEIVKYVDSKHANEEKNT